MRHPLLSTLCACTLTVCCASAWAQQGRGAQPQTSGVPTSAQLQRQTQLLRAWRATQTCETRIEAAQTVIQDAKMSLEIKHEALQSIHACEERAGRSTDVIKQMSLLRPNLKTYRRLESIAQQTREDISSTQIAGWRVVGKAASFAASSMLYLDMNVSPMLPNMASATDARDRRRVNEARKRVQRLHWLIPTIYSISGIVTRDGWVVMDDPNAGASARVVPLWRSGSVGARLRVNF